MSEMLSPRELLPRGAQAAIARELGKPTSVVAMVLTGKYPAATSKGAMTVRKVQVAVARRLRRRVDEVFPRTSSAT